jgi:acetylornithine deacetylase/succinyl-diaminopimelate desuccinylase-like protein
LQLPAGQFGLGSGGGAHAPDEFFLIDSVSPKMAGLDGATASYVDLFFALAEVR